MSVTDLLVDLDQLGLESALGFFFVFKLSVETLDFVIELFLAVVGSNLGPGLLGHLLLELFELFFEALHTPLSGGVLSV